MKRIHIILISILLLTINETLIAQVAKGSGIVKEVVRDLKGYTDIIAQGKFKLILVQGDREEIKIVTDDNLSEYFQTKLEGETLYIRMNANIKKFKEMSIYVSIKSLNSITLLGEVYLESNNVLQFEELAIFSGGMSRIDMEVFASKVDIEITDGTFATLKGYTEHLNMEVHDETELNAFELQADYCKVKSSGLTEVMINAEKDLQLMVTGSSNVYYTGEPKVSKRIFASTGFIVKRKKTAIGEGKTEN